jgi:hypothetical protein
MDRPPDLQEVRAIQRTRMRHCGPISRDSETCSPRRLCAGSLPGAMRIVALAITCVLAVAVSASASAAKKKSAKVPSVSTYEECESKALALGMPHGQTGHMEYVRECM